MFARLQREPSFATAEEGWFGVLRPLASTTAGLLFGAALVGFAALRVAPEPVVTPATDEAAPLAPIAALTAAPTVVPASSAAPAATVAPTATPTTAPAPPPAAAQPPPQASVYRYGGRTYATVAVAPATELAAPFAGRVEVRVYQLIDGQIRTGANAAGLPSFPYVIVRSQDRVFTLRPGALGSASEVLVTDGQTVDAGSPLVRVVGSGASSWATFYDSSVTAQVVASLVSASGQDLDATALFR